jgi:hypothetical protein
VLDFAGGSSSTEVLSCGLAVGVWVVLNKFVEPNPQKPLYKPTPKPARKNPQSLVSSFGQKHPHSRLHCQERTRMFNLPLQPQKHRPQKAPNIDNFLNHQQKPLPVRFKPLEF